MKAHLEHWDAKKYRVTKDYGNTSKICGPNKFAAQARSAWKPTDYGPHQGITFAEDNFLLGGL